MVATEVPRVKRSRKGGDGPSVEKVPTFLSPRPPAVYEDPSPYMVQWGLQNKDTIVEDSRAAAEWFKNVITPQDKAHVVESSDDLQIELLGAPAVASVLLEPFFKGFLSLLLVFSFVSYLP